MDRTAQHIIEERERALADQERLMEQIATESEARGQARGLAEGEAALRKVIESLCVAASIDLTQERLDQLAGASLTELERVSASLVTARAWPTD
jgi:hypothetical protein